MHLKIIIATILLVALADVSYGQQRETRRRSAYENIGQNQQQQQPQRNQQQNRSAYGNTDTTPRSAYGAQPAMYGRDTTLPIEVIRSSGNGLSDTGKMSLRRDGAVDMVEGGVDKIPLAYDPVREDDAVFRVRVWRDIDAREKINQSFLYAGQNDYGSERFISILMRGLRTGELTAFSGDDDRFTTPITPDSAMLAFGGGMDTVPVYDADGNVVKYQVREQMINPDSIYKFRLKEEWIFDKESGRLYVRILGIAPVIPYRLSTGQILPGSERPVWWIYYPDARTLLARSEVYNPKNMAARMSWEDLFESRMFSSYIVKSSMNNPFDLPLSSVYPNNTLYRLLEGDKIKEKIFNYEQNLWSY